ncbi:MAG TPA: fumarylacetoacetase [Candidatus Baltobacteraceae bacterium]
MSDDPTTDALLASWIPVDEASEFPIQNLPYGAFACGGITHLGVAIGDRILDLYALAQTGLCDEVCERELLAAPVLNPLLAAGRQTWTALRTRLSELLREGGDPALRAANADALFVGRNDVHMRLPMEIGDYVDFYSSLEHATNLGKMFRPDAQALLPNWRWLPVGYHGRAGTIVIDGTPIVRPNGQRMPTGAPAPAFGPSTMLDIELEVGFITGAANRRGEPLAIGNARDAIFGLVLLDDWSARDIQAWEYQPLGPFLGKSFATTISPWVVTLDALDPFRTKGPVQEPSPLEHLHTDVAWAYDIALDVSLASQAMREQHIEPATIARTNFNLLYWNMAQQLAHATSNGAIARPGDLFGSGTISGPTPDSLGSLIELTWRGARPIALPDGTMRAFLEDGDEVILSGRCNAQGARSIGFGQAKGTIVP